MVPTLVVRILSRPTDAEAVDQFRGPLQWRKSNGSNKAHRRQYMVVCSDLREFGSAAFGYMGGACYSTIISEYLPTIPPYIRTFCCHAVRPPLYQNAFLASPHISDQHPKSNAQ
jgi:hypothetical protein